MHPSDPSPPDPDPQVTIGAGAVFAGYRIESEIGRGGMGVVYRARHLALDRECALKLISPSLSNDPRFRERFRRESRLAASLEHPNVVQVDHAGDEGGILYLAMRLVDGSDLRRIVEAEGPLELGRAARLLGGVAAGLDAAHARGLIHRDVKPANVLVETVSGGERVFLTDFGVSRTTGKGGTVTSSGELLGSPDYMAPEQIAGDPVDHRADIYALGCLLHFALTGQPPFPRDNDMAKLFAHGNAPRPRPSELVPSLSEPLDRVVAQAMAVDPRQRYENAGQLAADLERVVRGAEPLARETAARREPLPDRTVTRRLQRPRGRRWPAVVAGVIALAAAAAIAVILIRGDNGSSGPTSPQSHAVDTVNVGREPTRLAVAPSRLWVASTGASALYAVDLVNDQQAHAPVATGGRPVSVGVGFHSLWALNKGSNALVRLAPPKAPIEIPVGADPTDIDFDQYGVWVVNRDDGTVSRIDPETNAVNATVKVGPGPTAIATGAGAVWVTSTVDRSVLKIDPGRATVVGKPIPVGRHPNQVTVGLGYVWVTDPATGTVTKIGPEAMHPVGDPIEVGNRPTAVATGVGYVWVANGADSTISRIDPRSRTVAGPPIGVGQDPVDVIVGKGAVWTANFGDSTVTRIRP
ncbi:MAG: protein kinase domain-containing protein [Solirubrobacterales bacterium]